jgi:hypothetical protein
MELILVAKDSMPIFFQSKNKELEDINVAAFISAVKSFAKGSLQSDLVSLKLGDLDIRLKEVNGFLYVLGMSINTELMPSEMHISKLIQDLGGIANNWVEKNNNKIIDVTTVPKETFSELIVNFEKEVLKDAELEQKNGSSKIVSSSIRDWNLLPSKTQEVLSYALEPVILGEKFSIIDNNPHSPIIKDLCKYFRLSKDIVPMLEKYDFEINISQNPTEGLIFDAENNKITGKFEKNKYLAKYIDKILLQHSVEHQTRLVTLLTSTIATISKTIINYESDYTTQEGKILNLLNNMEFEEVRLVLELIKRNRPSLHEKLIKLPIHKAWFNKW